MSLYQLEEIEPPSPTQICDIDEILYQAFDNAVSIGPAAEQTLGFANGEHWQTRSRIRRLEHGFQRLWPVLVAIASDEDDLLRLAKLPQCSIRSIDGQACTRKGLDAHRKLGPDGVPFRRHEQVQYELHLSCNIMIRHDR